MGSKLPIAVILDIICHCDVRTLKSFRLTSRSVNDLIRSYEASICANITDHILFTSEIRPYTPLLSETESTPLRILFILDHRIRSIKWLAAVGAENVDDEDPWGYLCNRNYRADDARGDLLRSIFSDGWIIHWQSWDIARKILMEQVGSNAGFHVNRLSLITRGLSSAKKIEDMILKEQKKYLRSISDREYMGYYYVDRLLGNVFRNRVFDKPGRKKSTRWRAGNTYEEPDSWLHWFILREGPQFFVRAWASKHGNEACLKLLRKEWAKRTIKQITFERDAYYKLFGFEFYNSRELPQETRAAVLEDPRLAHGIERVFNDVHFYLGRSLPKEVIWRMRREFSDYSS